ncbi:MAG: EAL domain-containing protein, partial [Lachnospiraceae bacterium]|nr:EAL domain-containing protein [Lachnospiraceae bacterium]
MKILYYDYCAFVIIFILIISILLKRMVHGTLNRFYFSLLIISMLSTCMDIMAVSYDNIGAGNITRKYIYHSAYLLFHFLTTPMYVLYVTALTDTWMRGKLISARRIIFSIPIVVVLVFLITNFKYGVLFYFDSNDVYARGSAFKILYIGTALYSLYGIVKLLRYRNRFENLRIISMLSGILFMIIATVIQFFFPNALLENFASSCGLLFIMLMVQRPDVMNDEVTGLLTINTFLDYINRSFYADIHKSIIVIKITNHDALQGVLGFDNTKMLLRSVALRIEHTKADKGKGEEVFYLENGIFAIIMGRSSEVEDVYKLGNHLNSVLQNPFNIDNLDINIQAIVCTANCPGDFEDVEMLFSFIKELGMNDYTGTLMFASEKFNREKYNLMKEMDSIIENALVEKRFMVYYQPIYNTKERKYRSAEALLRLKNDKYGFVSPELFIRAAEKSGAIHRIDHYVLEEVCRFMSSEEFKKSDMEYVEVNLSVVECMQTNLISKILPIIDRYDVGVENLNLEITETAMGDMQSIIHENINALHEYGLKFSLDDFGTGYSNMKRIASLPFSLIKIDKSMSTTVSNPRMKCILENTIKMIKELNMKIVVEGIETRELADYFANLGCDYIQGYYYARPMA